MDMDYSLFVFCQKFSFKNEFEVGQVALSKERFYRQEELNSIS